MAFFNLFFRQLIKVYLVLSAGPLFWGLHRVETKFFLFRLAINSMNCWLSNWVRSSEMFDWEISTQQSIIFESKFLTSLPLTLAYGSASIHLMKQSEATRMNLFCAGAVVKRPTMSMAYYMNGKGLDMIVRTWGVWYTMTVDHWHLPHFRIYAKKSYGLVTCLSHSREWWALWNFLPKIQRIEKGSRLDFL